MLLGGLHRSSTTLFSYVKRPTSKQHMQIELVNTSNLVSSVAQMQSLLPSQHDSTRLDQFGEFTQKKTENSQQNQHPVPLRLRRSEDPFSTKKPMAAAEHVDNLTMIYPVTKKNQ